MEFIVGLIVACIVIMLVVWLKKYIKLPSKDKMRAKKITKMEKQKTKEINKHMENASIVFSENYMARKEFLFWKYLNSILPKNFIAVPKVAVCTILTTHGDKNLYNIISDLVLDFVVFSAINFKPALVIDVYDKSYNDNRMEEEYPILAETLKKLKLASMHIMVAGDFDMESTKKDIFEMLKLDYEGPSDSIDS